MYTVLEYLDRWDLVLDLIAAITNCILIDYYKAAGDSYPRSIDKKKMITRQESLGRRWQVKDEMVRRVCLTRPVGDPTE